VKRCKFLVSRFCCFLQSRVSFWGHMLSWTHIKRPDSELLYRLRYYIQGYHSLLCTEFGTAYDQRIDFLETVGRSQVLSVRGPCGIEMWQGYNNNNNNNNYY
jgi:hypothetical protein